MSGEAAVLEYVTIAQYSEADQTTVVVASANIGTAVGSGGGGGAAEDITVDSTTLVGTGTDVQAVLEELDNGIADHLADTIAAHAASAISFSPNGSIAATDVQAAIQEVRDEAAGSTDLSYTASPTDGVVASSTGTDATLTLAGGTNAGLMAPADYTKLAGVESGATADQTANEILTALLGVDGPGSGLNADLLDGNEAAAFAAAGHNHSGVYEPAGTVATHEADTTNVHGITDTSALETTTGSQAKVDAHVNDTSDAHDASAISIADAGSYFTGTDAEAALQELGLTSAAATGFLNAFAGVTVPARSLDRFGAGPGITSTTLTTALSSTSTTTVVIGNSGLTRSGVGQKIRIDDEVIWVPAATAGGTTLTNCIRGVDGTTAATHSAGAKVSVSQVRQAVIFGDSTEQGTIGGFDTSSKRLRRTLAGLMGGDLGLGFRGVYRDGGVTYGTNTSLEWVHNGTFNAAFYYNDFDVAPRITLQLSSGTSNYSEWTRPIDETVRQIDVIWYNYTTFSGGDNWSYSLDGGSTWVDNPNTGSNPATGMVKRSRIICNNPTSIRIRAANAAGTGQLIYLLGVDVWSQPEDFGNTTGFKLHNIGVDGSTLSGLVRNTICVFDGVTNGTTTLTSATAAFTSNDVGRVIRGTNIPTGTTISAYTNSTTVTLSQSASGSATGGTVWVQGGAGDWAALLDGHPASFIPDLVFCGKWTNDAANDANTGGQQGLGTSDALSFGYCLDTFLTRVTPYADVVCSAPFEQGTVRLDGTNSTSTIQATYRAKLVSKAAEYGVASIDEYAALVAGGVTGYAAANSAGLMNDYLHPSAKLYREIAARRDRVLTVLGGVGGRRTDLTEALLSTAGQLAYRDSSGIAAVTAPTVAGQRLRWTGSALAYSEPEGFAVVASDVTHTQSNTNLSDVTGLAVPIGSSSTEIWFFEAYLLMNAANTTVDMKFGFTVPTSCTMKWGTVATGGTLGSFTIVGGTGSSPTVLVDQTGTIAGPSANGTVGVSLGGMIFGGGTSGNVQLQFAQNTSNASDLIVQKGSMLRYRRLAA